MSTYIRAIHDALTPDLSFNITLGLMNHLTRKFIFLVEIFFLSELEQPKQTLLSTAGYEFQKKVR